MEGLLVASQGLEIYRNINSVEAQRVVSPQSIEISLVNASTERGNKDVNDNVSVAFGDPIKALTIQTQKIIDKLREVLDEKFPSLNTEQQTQTPEQSADTVLKGISQLFDRYKEQHSELGAEELMSRFFENVRKGVASGYASAVSTLTDIDAFTVSGVENAVSQTKAFIEKKLSALEEIKREELGLSVTTTEVATTTSQAVLVAAASTTQQGGLDVRA